MSDQDMQMETNDQLVLIAGLSAAGKSASLRNIRNQENWFYMNTEAGKKLPFRNKFQNFRIADPWEVVQGLDWAMDPENPNPPDGIIVDSLTFLLDMFETQYIVGRANSMKAWGDYNQFFKTLLQDRVIRFGKPVKTACRSAAPARGCSSSGWPLQSCTTGEPRHYPRG